MTTHPSYLLRRPFFLKTVTVLIALLVDANWAAAQSAYFISTDELPAGSTILSLSSDGFLTLARDSQNGAGREVFRWSPNVSIVPIAVVAALALVPIGWRLCGIRNRIPRHAERYSSAALFVALAAMLPVASAKGQEQLKLVATDAAPETYFGHSIALSGNLGLVGAWPPDYIGNHSAFAHGYLFDATTGQHIRKLTAPNGGRWFGDVALNSYSALIGAPGDVNYAGAVYTFDLITGQQVHRLAATDAAREDFFGTSIAVSGNQVLVGAPGDRPTGNGTVHGAPGSAYLFDGITGQQLRKLTPLIAGPSDDFGQAVAMTGDIAVIGAFDSLGTGGAAYVFNVATGQQLLKLKPSDAALRNGFGRSVAIEGNIALIGAWGDGNSTGTQSIGSAYLFDVTTGQELSKLTATDRAEGDLFGFKVELSGNTAIVGAPGDDNSTGSVYLFDVTTGQQVRKFIASDGTANDRFGAGLAAIGNTAVIGANGDGDGGFNSGSAYIFQIGSVPEPSTLLLTALALIPLARRSRRDRALAVGRSTFCFSARPAPLSNCMTSSLSLLPHQA